MNFFIMASASPTFKFSSLLAALFAVAKMAIAGDPDIISDFIVKVLAHNHLQLSRSQR